MKPRVLFVGRSRISLPLDETLARKWDAVAEELDIRVLATGRSGEQEDERFRLVTDRVLVTFYALLPLLVREEVRRFDPDVIVAQSPYEAVAVRPVRGRARLLLEVHGDWNTAPRLYGSPFRSLLEPASRRLARAAVRSADAVRTVSPFTSRLVTDAGGSATATFTAYTDVSAFTRTPPQPLPDQPSALFVGVLERYKNVAGLAAAWRLAAPQVPNARLRLVGDGRETGIASKLVADLPGQTEWTRRLTSDEVAEALDRATVLLLPSFSEGLPRIVMEAFARGRPVVGARAGGIPDIVEDGVNGLLVDPHVPGSIADALVRVLSERALAERLAAGAAASAERWLQPPEVYARRLRELVEGLL
ncbi:MAG TPA: glycosyltransferase family 4 protein [Gaiellaceae bacterium]|jgi:glycosyltransferase involved in cell wall biosynthesis|nr:glycosyltransferase family 4 protein [Gaiellaceae bacterium]